MREMSDQTQIARLIEVGARIIPAGCKLDVADVVDDISDLEPSELELMAGWASHRQHEFATGRRCAREALDSLGFGGRARLGADADGVPVWPEGFVGSISHCRGVAAALAGLTCEYALVGLDLEKTNRLSGGAMKRVLHPEEVEFVQDDQVKASILFGLKEAFYKAQFPRHRTQGNFQDLALSVDTAAGRAKVSALDARFAGELRALNFAYSLVGDYVLSLCWLESK